MTGAKSNGFASVFISTKFTSQFRKLKSRDCQMKFAMNQSRLRNVEAGTKFKLFDLLKIRNWLMKCKNVFYVSV